MVKEAKEIEGKEQREAIKRAVDEAQAEGFPSDIEERETYCMEELHKGQERFLDGSDPVGAALCFYRAMKVHPEPKVLINIYDTTVPKDILQILAVMCAQDKELSHKMGMSAARSESGHGVE